MHCISQRHKYSWTHVCDWNLLQYFYHAHHHSCHDGGGAYNLVCHDGGGDGDDDGGDDFFCDCGGCGHDGDDHHLLDYKRHGDGYDVLPLSITAYY